MRRRPPSPRAQKNHLVDELHEYSAADITRLFKLPGSVVRALERAGYITAGSNDAPARYTHADSLVLRLAAALHAAKVSGAPLVAAIGRIRATLPPGEVLTAMALAAAGDADQGVWSAEPAAGGSRTQAAPFSQTAEVRIVEAEAHYVRGLGLEESDVAAARDAYLLALRSHGQHIDARINLGRLLHLDGQFKAAERVYRQAEHAHALLSFNLASLLEDMDREDEAIAAYRDALALDPHLHDAHFNLSRLHEKAQRPRDALRHLLAYRRQQARHGT